jgi:lysine 2,3-aminomutase
MSSVKEVEAMKSEMKNLQHHAVEADSLEPPHLMQTCALNRTGLQSAEEIKDDKQFPHLISLKPGQKIRGGSALSFRRRCFPGVNAAQWNDWRWQVRNRIGNPAALGRIMNLMADEQAAMAMGQTGLPFAVTPYYLSLIDFQNPDDPLRKAVVPTIFEQVVSPGESLDPLGEDHDTVAPGLVHRYPDRVLLLATGFCSTYCRYCTRSRLVGKNTMPHSRKNLDKAIAYIAEHREVRDVLISGGDPLTMGDERLEWLLASLRRIKHVEIIRLGTKTPAVLPQRITPALVRMLRKYHPLFMSLHFMHPAELTPECARACARLADAGIPLGSQTVLLKGVNDSVQEMRRLMQGLLGMRVRPYYLYQCDPIAGSSHFRTPVEKGLEIIKGLRGHTSGYAVPTYVIDAPGGGGKIPLCPESLLGRQNGEILLRNFQDGIFSYPELEEIQDGPIDSH